MDRAGGSIAVEVFLSYGEDKDLWYLKALPKRAVELLGRPKYMEGGCVIKQKIMYEAGSCSDFLLNDSRGLKSKVVDEVKHIFDNITFEELPCVLNEVFLCDEDGNR